MQKEETFQFLWFILESFPKKACLNKQKKDLELFLSQAVQVQLQLSETAAVRTIPGNKSAQKLLQRYHGEDRLPSAHKMNVQLIL